MPIGYYAVLQRACVAVLKCAFVEWINIDANWILCCSSTCLCGCSLMRICGVDKYRCQLDTVLFSNGPEWLFPCMPVWLPFSNVHVWIE